ncbi:MAG: hypothetical protein VB125_00455 [Burkholderia sp.]
MGIYKHLSCEERTLIHLGLEQGCKTPGHGPEFCITRRVRSAANCAVTAGVRQNQLRRRGRAVRCSLAAIVRRSPSSALSSSGRHGATARPA